MTGPVPRSEKMWFLTKSPGPSRSWGAQGIKGEEGDTGAVWNRSTLAVPEGRPDAAFP